MGARLAAFRGRMTPRAHLRARARRKARGEPTTVCRTCRPPTAREFPGTAPPAFR